MKVEYAEECNYWKTSKSSTDSWMEKSERLITDIGGVVEQSGFIMQNGSGAYLIAFRIGEDVFRLIWPVLKSVDSNIQAAKVQAATMIYHDVKAKVVSAKVLGARVAFFPWWEINHTPAFQLLDGELSEQVPKLLTYQPPR